MLIEINELIKGWAKRFSGVHTFSWPNSDISQKQIVCSHDHETFTDQTNHFLVAILSPFSSALAKSIKNSCFLPKSQYMHLFFDLAHPKGK